MLDRITRNLNQYPAVDRFPEPGGQREAAVLLALTAESEPELVLTQRAAHLKDHAGEVAFPGGMWEAEDASLKQTALRESHEEIALPPAAVTLISVLPRRSTRLGVRVTPYVGVVDPGLELRPEPSELAAVFRVPLRFLLDRANLGRDQFRLAGEEYSLPCYHFDGYQVWGFTLAVLVDFLNRSLAAGIELRYPPINCQLAR